MGFSVASVFSLAVGFARSGRSFFFNGRNDEYWNAVSPAHIDCGADEAGAGGIFKHCDILNLASETAEVSQLFNGQLQSIALMNEDGGTIQDKLNGGAVANDECGQCRAGTLTLIGLSLAAAFAGMLPVTMRVRRACGTWFTHNAGRYKRRLVLAINRYERFRHWVSPYAMKVLLALG
jgi:hypothetical protein